MLQLLILIWPYFMKNTLPQLMLLASLFFSTAGFTAERAANKQQAISIVQKSHPGRVLSVKQKNSHYIVKVLDDKGNIRLVKVDSVKGKTVRKH